MCAYCGCGIDANGNEMRVVVKATVRVAEGQSKDIINGFDEQPPYGRGN